MMPNGIARWGVAATAAFLATATVAMAAGELILENNMRIEGALTVTGAMAVARQGDVQMGSYTSGVPALGSVEMNAWYQSPSGGVYTAGNVEIGTDTQTADLHVSGTTEMAGDAEIGGDVEVDGDLEVGGRVSDGMGILLPVGSIIAFGGTNVPLGWLICNGQAYLRSNPALQDLFAVIGTSFGAPSETTFRAPDLRGRFPRGVDNGAGVDPDRSSRTNVTGGNTGDKVGSRQGHEVAYHDHDVTIYNTGGASHWLLHRQDINESSYSSGSTLSHGGNETRPININVNYIIKY